MHAAGPTITHVHAKITPVKRSYEPGMKVSYDAGSKRVVVAFRGRIKVLPGTFETEGAGTEAGEFHCRTQGWKPNDQAHADAKRVRSLF
jgi:hypothetical protein